MVSVPFSEQTDDGPPLSTLELIEVYQRALYEALTTVNDGTPEWVYLNHSLGVATVMDLDSFVPAASSGSGDPK